MSILSGPAGLLISVDDGFTNGEYPGYTPQIAQQFTISKADIEIDFTPGLACGWVAARYQDQPFLRPGPHGQGNCCGLVFNETVINGGNYVPTFGARFAPTEPGRSTDGASLHVGSSHNKIVGINAAGDGTVRVTNIAHWLDPDRVITTIPKSTRALSDFNLEMYDTIGFEGDNQIIHRLLRVHVPDYAEVRQFPFVMTYAMTHYMNHSTFNVAKRINPTTGGLTEVFPEDGNTLMYSETEPFLWSNSAGSLSCAVYYEISKLVPDPDGTRGFMGTRFSTGLHANAFGQYGHAEITDFDAYCGTTEEYQAWLVVGEEDEIGPKVADLFAAYP